MALTKVMKVKDLIALLDRKDTKSEVALFVCRSNLDPSKWEYVPIMSLGLEKENRSKHMAKFKIGDFVRKKSGSEWEGEVVGTYSTNLTNEGYCVESNLHRGSVQIYPAAALELI